MAQTVADRLLERLREWDVEVIFGYPGDGINGIIGALAKADNRPRFIQSRHEEMSAFEAVGYAKFTGRTGVCLATSGGGAIHLLNGLYDAKLDHVPVVAIVGQTARSAMGGSYQQEVDLQTLFKDVASDYLVEVNVPSQLPNAIDRAMRIAQAGHCATCVIIPSDVQDLSYTPPMHEFRNVPSSRPGYHGPQVRPTDEDLRLAADVINAGSRVAMLVGQGARGAVAELLQLAELTGAGVAKALLGKDVLADDLPFVTGTIGLVGTRPSYELMEGCDTLLIIGSSFPYTQFMPDFDQARAVQIDIDSRMVGLRYPTEVNLVGDAAQTLRALIPLVEHKRDRAWREQIESNVADWWSVVERQAMMDAKPINPMRIVWELSRRIPEDAIVTCDAGSAATWYARDLKMRGTMRSSLSGTLASMGSGVPYAIGGKIGHPDRPAVALVGDGAMQMNGLAELVTIGQYWEQWPDPRCVVCVFHNNDLNQVTWELRAFGGYPRFEPSQKLADISYASFAANAGLDGIEVGDPDEVGPAWDRALAANRPVVLDIRCDPNIPPIPPHVAFEQMKDTAAALLRGDPEAWAVFTRGMHTKAQEFLPGRGRGASRRRRASE